jgi:hypothetical protein
LGECDREGRKQRRHSRGVVAGCVSRAASRRIDLGDSSLGGSVPVDARGATMGGPRSTASTDQIAFADPRRNPDRMGAWVGDVTLGRCVAWPHRAEGSKSLRLGTSCETRYSPSFVDPRKLSQHVLLKRFTMTPADQHKNLHTNPFPVTAAILKSVNSEGHGQRSNTSSGLHFHAERGLWS